MSDGDLSQGVWVDVGEDGRVVLPSDALAAASLQPGGRVMVRVIDGAVQLLSHQAAAHEAQMIAAGFVPLGGSVVDEFLAERRQAGREEIVMRGDAAE